MNRSRIAGLVVLLAGGMTGGALGADPETIGRSRAPAARGFVPERVDVSKLHGRAPEPRERRSLYERVESDVDRGRGRIEDEQAYQARRFQDARDERLGRIQPQREAERFEEEYDRQRRIDAARARQERARRVDDSSATNIVREPASSGVGSALSRFVAEQEQLLDDARRRYQNDLRTAETQRDSAFRAARSNAERSAAMRKFTERRAELTRSYQSYRRGILGSD